MGFLDSLRRRKGGDKSADSGEIGPGDPAAADPTDFRPRTDGIYRAAPEADGPEAGGSGSAAGSCLQFTGMRVRETTGASEVVRSGEYTSTGRFSVNAPFEMLVAFTVVEIGDDYFLARRTAAQDRSTAELRYEFRPSVAPDGDG